MTIRRSLVLGVFAAIGCGTARAQLVDQFISPFVGANAITAHPTVLSRQQSDYQGSGIRIGSFVIRPNLQESAGYETNVLARPKPTGSPILETNFAVEAASDISRVNVRAQLGVDDVRYFDLPRQSYTNWNALLSGSYEIGRDLVSAQYSHAKLVQTARDLDVPQLLDQAIDYSVDSGRLAYRANFNRLSVTPAVDLAAYAYSNGSVGGQPFRQDYRDRTLVTPGLTLAYEVSPGRSVVLVVRNTIGSYARTQQGLPRRDYNDTAVLAGFDYDATGLIRVRALAGYETRNFNASTYRSIQSPIAELSAIWTPTRLTTLTANVARRIQDSTEDTLAATTQTSARLRLDHEYLRNVLLLANAGIANDAYQGGGGQTLYLFGGGVTYLLNRRVGLTATYDFIARQKNAAVSVGNVTLGSDYTDHRFLLRFRFLL